MLDRRLATYPRELGQGFWYFLSSRHFGLKDVIWESRDKERLVSVANIEPKAIQQLFDSPSDVLVMIMIMIVNPPKVVLSNLFNYTIYILSSIDQVDALVEWVMTSILM